GYFADTQSPRVLAEEFLLIPNKGGIAAWAPSSYAFPSVNSPITEELFRALFVDNDLILGSAATTARLTAYLANSHLPLGLFEVFTYFGDPAVKLNLPATLELSGQDSPDPVVMGESITYSLAYTVSGAEEAPGLTLANTLPDHVTYQSASPPPSTVDGQVLTWNLGNVPGSPPSSGLVEITARLNTSGLAHNQQVINQAGLTDYFGGNGSLQMKTAALDAPIAGLAAGHDGPTFLGSQTTFTASTQAGSNVVYHWDFGDGSSGGQGASVQHTYVATGTYVAQVTATNGAGSDSATTTLKIRDIPPVAGFTSSAPDKIGQTSAFESTSSGTNLVYTWDFGDGSPPVSGQSPEVSHTYPLTGSYTAILTATNSEGSSTFSGTIDILQSVIPPLAGFTSSSPTPLFQMTVFTNTSRDGGEDPEGLTYLWDFGDGSPGSYEPHPGHLYANTGAYVVSLTIGNSAGEDVFSDTVNITAAPHTLLLPVIVKGSSP
ncbi:MAG: PKD domain-containing protein, partial [Anaerolineae bacterium]